MKLLLDLVGVCLAWASGVLRPLHGGASLPAALVRVRLQTATMVACLPARRVVTCHMTHAPPSLRQTAD
ncbi:hypothetical protein WAE61_20565 [Comamonadaceae bacterium PP-2]